jgi:hypothetical protein
MKIFIGRQRSSAQEDMSRLSRLTIFCDNRNHSGKLLCHFSVVFGEVQAPRPSSYHPHCVLGTPNSSSLGVQDFAVPRFRCGHEVDFHP